MEQRRYALYLSFLLGLWLLISPWIFGVSSQTTLVWSHVIAGIIIALLALYRVSDLGDESRTWASWLMALFGLWAIVAPWVLGFSGQSSLMLSNVIDGIIVLILGVWSTTTGQHVTPPA